MHCQVPPQHSAQQKGSVQSRRPSRSSSIGLLGKRMVCRACLAPLPKPRPRLQRSGTRLAGATAAACRVAAALALVFALLFAGALVIGPRAFGAGARTFASASASAGAGTGAGAAFADAAAVPVSAGARLRSGTRSRSSAAQVQGRPPVCILALRHGFATEQSCLLPCAALARGVTAGRSSGVWLCGLKGRSGGSSTGAPGRGGSRSGSGNRCRHGGGRRSPVVVHRTAAFVLAGRTLALL